MTYIPRILDRELDELSPEAPAIALDGPKFVGKTTTAKQRAQDVLRLDNPLTQEIVAADPFNAILNQSPPLLIDEWQKVPAVWDAVRRAVDDAPNRQGRYLLTGSATPRQGATSHSGAGRILRLRMRPMTLSERGVGQAGISLQNLLCQGPCQLTGRSDVPFHQYIEELCRSGFPGIRAVTRRQLRTELTSYIHNRVDRDLPELGVTVRHRAGLLDWLRSYALCSATTASYKKIIELATPGEVDPPARDTLDKYRDLLR